LFGLSNASGGHRHRQPLRRSALRPSRIRRASRRRQCGTVDEAHL